MLTRRSVSISSMPRDSLGKVTDWSTAAWSMPTTPANLSQSLPRGARGSGTVIRCTRSGARSRPRLRVAAAGAVLARTGSSQASGRRQRAIRILGLERLAVLAKLWVLPCLTLCCHSAGTWRARSRPVTITWISAPSAASSLSTQGIREGGVAAKSSEWLTSPSPSQSASSRQRRGQAV